MKRRDLTLLSFKKVSYKAWTKLALIWTQLQSFWMPLAPSLTTADMQRHSLTSWWPAECWVSRRRRQRSHVEIKVNDAGLVCLSVQPLVGLYLTTWPALTTASLRHKKTWRQCKHMLRYTAHGHWTVCLCKGLKHSGFCRVLILFLKQNGLKRITFCTLVRKRKQGQKTACYSPQTHHCSPSSELVE